MCEAGRIRHHLKHNLWRRECTIVFVGYQVPGTLGYALLNGATEVKLFGEPVRVAAKILNLPGISGHADRDHLVEWVRGIEEKPEQVFVVHGQDTVTDHFAAFLTEETGISAVAPYSGDSYDLTENRCVARGDRVRIVKKTIPGTTMKAPLARLVAAAERLLLIAKSSGERANKDQKKFADQVEDLCSKWEMKKGRTSEK
jgi:metallo-beta-lactamase family protein